MKPGKYAGHKFTKDQKTAQRLWRLSDSELSEINEALKICNWGSTRKQLHDRLDRRLDAIEKRNDKAKALFPDVDESFTIASMTISL